MMSEKMTTSVFTKSVSRRQLLGGFAGLAIGVLGACAPSVPSTSTSVSKADAPAGESAAPATKVAPSNGQVTISFSSQGNEVEFAMFDAIIDGFEKSQSKIKVNRNYDPTLSWPKIINMIRTGVAADMQRCDDDSIYVMTAADQVTVLDDYFKRDLRACSGKPKWRPLIA